MLVLSRRLGESLVINDQLVLTVAFLAKDSVELSLINVSGSLLGTSTARVNESVQLTDDIEVVAIHFKEEKGKAWRRRTARFDVPPRRILESATVVASCAEPAELRTADWSSYN
jgi:sRNA-binding carbon storage regulator CsrA